VGYVKSTRVSTLQDRQGCVDCKIITGVPTVGEVFFILLEDLHVTPASPRAIDALFSNRKLPV
jgi:hypothetical protein